MNKYIFTIVSILIALMIWFLESVLHHYVFNESEFELIPSNLNEIWMRAFIIFLVVLFGVFADSFSKKQAAKEKQLESMRIYKSMVDATQHILNNLLNQVQLFKMEAEACKEFNPDVLKEFDGVTNEASGLV